ncbi:MAG: phosphoribulokinase [Thiothrix sp.]|nr:MAG: phosphoribulokinase [Thiothrix sp.]
MSAEFPIVAITGASDHSTTTITQALQHIFYRERIKAVYVSGSGFHRYDRKTMRTELLKARQEGRNLSHFGPEGNHFDKLDSLFFQYAATGTGQFRYYLHSEQFAQEMGLEPGTFSPWQQMDPDNDLLLYRGLHGAVIHEDIDIASYPDLLIGAIPSINLEMMRRIDRDLKQGLSHEEVRQVVLDRMSDYVKYITPQFGRTHLNFQIMPMVDTSNPFQFDEVPSLEECYIVIHFQKIAKRFEMPKLLKVIPNAFMTRRDQMVVPGTQMKTAIEIILMPLIQELIIESRRIKGVAELAPERGAGVLGFKGQLVH